MEKLAIVILNWNGRSLLEQFLPQLVQHTPDWAEIIIADNASTDNSLQWLSTHYPTIRTVVNEKNYGFAEGYNIALKQIEAQYYCLLNSDIEVTPHWLDGIIEYMDTHAEIGICQPKLLSYCERQKFEYAGAGGGFIDKFGYPFCRGRIFSHTENDLHQYDDIREIFWASGACMFVRSELYHQLGGLDPLFFAHMEEIDFCWRVQLKGEKIMYYPSSMVYHVGGGTLPKQSSRKTFLNFRNNMLLLYKNLPQKQFYYVSACRLILDMVAAGLFLSQRHWGDFKAVFAARRAYRKMKVHYKTLRKTHPAHRVGNIYQKSIVWQHYAKRISLFTDLNSKDFD